jgi:hypothetical protein
LLISIEKQAILGSDGYDSWTKLMSQKLYLSNKARVMVYGQNTTKGC